MSQSNLPRRNPQLARRNASKRSQPKSPNQQSVSQFPQPISVPAWLRSLLTIHGGAKLICGSIFGLMFLAYGYTVYTQGIWEQEHDRLQRLQQQERQQEVMSENLKQQLSTAAEQLDSGLVVPKDPAKRMLVMPSEQQRPAKQLPPSPITAPITVQPPSGY